MALVHVAQMASDWKSGETISLDVLTPCPRCVEYSLFNVTMVREGQPTQRLYGCWKCRGLFEDVPF